MGQWGRLGAGGGRVSVIALTLYMQVSHREPRRCSLEGIKWLLGPQRAVKAAGEK